MKHNTAKRFIIAIFVLIFVCALCACTAPAFEIQTQNADGTLTVAGALIEQTVNSLAKLVQMAFFALAAFAADKLGKNLKLKNLNIAVQKVCELARQTAGELQQTIVDNIKAENPDGKLTKDQIDDLSRSLLYLVKAKLDTATQELIIASGSDLDALITGECESYLNMLKNSPVIIGGSAEILAGKNDPLETEDVPGGKM